MQQIESGVSGGGWQIWSEDLASSWLCGFVVTMVLNAVLPRENDDAVFLGSEQSSSVNAVRVYSQIWTFLNLVHRVILLLV